MRDHITASERADMQTEIAPSDSASDRVPDQAEPTDREERRLEALQRMYGRVLEAEERSGVKTLKRIDAAVRGETPHE
jgi:hypothetical protein